MKLLEEMTFEELAGLNPDQLEKLVQLEVANEGVKFASRPEELQMKRLPIERSERGFKVGDAIFERQEDAEIVAKMPRLKEGYSWDYGHSNRWLEVADEAKVETVFYFKKSDITANRSAIRQHAEDKEITTKALEAWEKYENAITNVRDSVFSKYWSAQRKVANINAAKAKLEEFKTLADGNEETAKRFFIKALAGNEEMLVAVLGENWNAEAAKEVANAQA